MSTKSNQKATQSTNSKPAKKAEGFKNKAGDLIEKVGHVISNAGAQKIGQKIHDIGDSMEKSHKNSKHPHKV